MRIYRRSPENVLDHVSNLANRADLSLVVPILQLDDDMHYQLERSALGSSRRSA